jgi:cytochrome b561
MNATSPSSIQSLWSRALSIAIFLLVLLQLYQSTKVATTPKGSAAREALTELHLSVGLTLFLLVLPRLWFWWRETRPARPARVPPAADGFARNICLLAYITVAAFGISGCLYAWSRGHHVSWFGFFTLPQMIEANYVNETRFGYLHSALGFWVFYLAGLGVVTMLHQRLRYGAPLLRLLPGFAWSHGDAARVS